MGGIPTLRTLIHWGPCLGQAIYGHYPKQILPRLNLVWKTLLTLGEGRAIENKFQRGWGFRASGITADLKCSWGGSGFVVFNVAGPPLPLSQQAAQALSRILTSWGFGFSVI